MRFCVFTSLCCVESTTYKKGKANSFRRNKRRDQLTLHFPFSLLQDIDHFHHPKSSFVTLSSQSPTPQGQLLFFFLIYLFIYLLLLFFLAALGLHCCARGFSNCGERGLPFIAVCGLLIAVDSLAAEHGLQAHGLQQLWHESSAVVARGLQSAGSIVVAHRLISCSSACGIFPDEGSNPCPLHWQADSFFFFFFFN